MVSSNVLSTNVLNTNVVPYMLRFVEPSWKFSYLGSKSFYGKNICVENPIKFAWKIPIEGTAASKKRE